MYLSFFGIAEKPFAITPDPRYLYLSARTPMRWRTWCMASMKPAASSSSPRGRYRQDHDYPLTAGAGAEERGDRADPQSTALAR